MSANTFSAIDNGMIERESQGAACAIGIVPSLKAFGGGVYQYNLTIPRTMYELKSDTVHRWNSRTGYAFRF